MTAKSPYKVTDQLRKEWEELDERVQLIKESGKFVSNEEIVLYIRWRYRKGRTWVYANVLKYLRWYERPTANGRNLRYLTYQEARQQIEKLMG